MTKTNTKQKLILGLMLAVATAGLAGTLSMTWNVKSTLLKGDLPAADMVQVTVAAANERQTATLPEQESPRELITLAIALNSGEAETRQLKTIQLNKLGNFPVDQIHALRIEKSSGEHITSAIIDDPDELTGTIVIRFASGASETSLRGALNIKLLGTLTPRREDKNTTLQYVVAKVEVEPTEASLTSTNLPGPIFPVGEPAPLACEPGKTDQNGVCSCPNPTTLYNDWATRPTIYKDSAGRQLTCIPCAKNDLVAYQGALACPGSVPPSEDGTLTIKMHLPPEQPPMLKPGSSNVRVLGITLGKQRRNSEADALSHFSLIPAGTLPASRLSGFQLWREGTGEPNQKIDRVTITPSAVNNYVSVDFNPALPIESGKKFVLYATVDVKPEDQGKTLQYKVSGVTTTPADGKLKPIYCASTTDCNASYFESIGPILKSSKKATITLKNNVKNDNNGTSTPSDFALFINGSSTTSGLAVELAPGDYTVSQSNKVEYQPSGWSAPCVPVTGDPSRATLRLEAEQSLTCEITNDDIPPGELPPPPPPPKQPYCESIGKYTYNGPDMPGLLYGACIDCSMDIFVLNNGSCQATVAVDTPPEDTPPLGENGTSTEIIEQIDQTCPQGTFPFSGKCLIMGHIAPNGDQDVGTSTPEDAQNLIADPDIRRGSAYDPELSDSQRLVYVPERGGTGPEILIYLAIVGAIQSGRWLLKKR